MSSTVNQGKQALSALLIEINALLHNVQLSTNLQHIYKARSSPCT